jgi:Malectin domain
VPVVAPVFLPILINCGGEAFTDSEGRFWAADEYYTGGIVSRTGTEIIDTDDDELYKTERYGEMTYSIQVPDGIFTIILHFAEI